MLCFLKALDVRRLSQFVMVPVVCFHWTCKFRVLRFLDLNYSVPLWSSIGVVISTHLYPLRIHFSVCYFFVFMCMYLLE